MCGLFGAIGRGWNLGTIRALAMANRDRGTDSLGFFNSDGKVMKKADDPWDALQAENVTRWLIASAKGSKDSGAPSWFLAGHTRMATRGKVNRQNSHPFRYGNIVGAHNGMVDAPNKYVVDSMYLFDTLNKAHGDYNKAWGKIVGYWGIVWYNFEENAFYMQSHRGDLHFAMADDGVIYYSSDKKHLLVCIGHVKDVHKIAEGETFKFTCDADGKIVVKEVAKFVSKAAEYWSYRYGASNARWDDEDLAYYNNTPPRRRGSAPNKGWQTRATGGYTYTTTTPSNTASNDSDVKDWDSEWRAAWASYCGTYEHSLVD